MLIISLIASAILLLGVNLIVFRPKHPVARTIAFSAAFVLGSACLLGVLPVVMQGLLLALVVIAWRASGGSLARFLRLSCGATLAAYGAAGWLAWQQEREYVRLRARYPYESMEARLPALRPDERIAPPEARALSRLERLESEIGDDRRSFRESQLQILHERAVSLFLNSPGFGASRMFRPSERGLASGIREDPIVSQPGPRGSSRWSPGDFDSPQGADLGVLGGMHLDSVKDFVFAPGFGYFKDRRHVAGFLPHRISQVPAAIDRSPRANIAVPIARWRVRTLELVGMLLHETPVVYVSEHLPRMAELRARPLDSRTSSSRWG